MVGIPKNFVLRFAGKVPAYDISKYDEILCHPFGSGARGVPVVGYRSLIFHGIPIIWTEDGEPQPESDLAQELTHNPACTNQPTIRPPAGFSPQWP